MISVPTSSLGLTLMLAIAAVPALAQESSELPGKGVTAAQPVTVEELRFTKGKGPGRGNSYLSRYEEDYSYLRDPARSSDLFDPLKFIPLDPEGGIYLTLNGEIRFRYDNTDHRSFSIAGSAAPPKLLGGRPVLTPAAGTSTNQLYKQRYALGGDLHIGPNLRFYAELYHGQQTGHDVGPAVPGNQRDELGLVNGFGEVSGVDGGIKSGLRAGRQQVYLGNDLQVRANVSTNLPSPVFDGFRVYRDWGDGRIDSFAYNLVKFNDGKLQDLDIPHVNLWGVYLIQDLPKLSLPIDGELKTTADLFWLGWRSKPFTAGAGGGVYDDQALLNGTRIVAATGAGFIASQDHRNTVGLRLYGDAGPSIDYDWQGAYQTGSYAAFRVDAFAVNTDTGYTLHDVPWKPRIGIHIDAASGGADKAGKSLHTYQPMYPNTTYYAPNNEFAPTNFYDIAPRIGFSPTATIKLEYYYSLLWRWSQQDAVYIGAPWPGGQGQNNYAVTALLPGRVIGRQSDLRLSWSITPHLLTLCEFGLFWPGSALRAAGGRVTAFLDANLTVKF